MNEHYRINRFGTRAANILIMPKKSNFWSFSFRITANVNFLLMSINFSGVASNQRQRWSSDRIIVQWYGVVYKLHIFLRYCYCTKKFKLSKSIIDSEQDFKHAQCTIFLTFLKGQPKSKSTLWTGEEAIYLNFEPIRFLEAWTRCYSAMMWWKSLELHTVLCLPIESLWIWSSCPADIYLTFKVKYIS